MKVERVCIRIDVTGPTDRDPWEWGEGIAKFLESELIGAFGPIKCECVDWDYDRTTLSRTPGDQP